MCYIQLFQGANVIFDSTPVKGLGAVIGLYVVYWLGLRSYFSQKGFGNVRLRYLDAGLDLASSQVEYALSIFGSNWALLLRYAKLCRDLKAPFDAKDFFAQFRELDQAQFQIMPAHRVTAFFPSVVIWSAYQQVFSFVGTANDEIKADLGPALEMLSKNPSNPNRSAIFSEAENLALKLDKTSGKSHIYLSKLNNLSQVFEQQWLRRKDLQKFSKRKNVREILARLEAAFPGANAA